MEYNNDMIPYMALALELDGEEPSVVHTRTYELLYKELGDNKFKILTTGPETSRWYNDPAHFEKLLMGYRIKPAYNWLVYIAYKSGFSLNQSTIIPNVIAFILIIMLLFHWAKQTIYGWHWIYIVFISLFYPLIKLVRFSTPDGISTLFVIGVLWAIYFKKSWWYICTLLVLSVLSRVDNLLLAMSIAFYHLVSEQRVAMNKSKIFFSFFASVLLGVSIYIVVSFFSGNSPTWIFSFIKHIDINYYLFVARGMVNTILVSYYPILAFLGYLCYPYFTKAMREIFIIYFSYMLIRLLLFPNIEERFFTSIEPILLLFFTWVFIQGRVNANHNKYGVELQ